MRRMLEHERKRLANEFLARCQDFTLEQLQNVRKNYLRSMGSGRMPFPEDVDLNYEIAARLTARVKALAEEEQRRERTPEELLHQEAARLAKANGVSVKIAEGVLRRMGYASSDALDVVRTDRKPAPEPEPALAEPTAREKWEQKWGKR